MTNRTELTKEKPTNNEWVGDLMGRKQYSTFLTEYILSLNKSLPEGCVIAIDAPWGYGKTFFVNRWAEDLSAKHLVFQYDAWKNDINQDALISFISSISASLEEKSKKLPAVPNLERKIEDSLKTFYKTIRKAIWPTTKTAAQIAIKKLTGHGIEEITKMLLESDVVEEGRNEGKLNEAIANAAIDKYFQEIITSQATTFEAIENFRESFQSTLNLLNEAKQLNSPTFVFIDEIDRCRPDYAIKLLEGVKHLFNIPNTIFIFSTNIEQLSNSVCSIYGEKFDGAMYLKRFFNFEFELPHPSTKSFIDNHVVSPFLRTRKTITGLDRKLQAGKDQTNTKAIELIATALRLDLRSLDRCLHMFHASASGLKEDDPILVIWLFFLCAVRHHHPSLFTKIHRADMKFEDFCTELNGVIKSNVKVDYAKMSGHQQTLETITIAQIIQSIYSSINETAQAMLRRAYNSNTRYPDYPDSIQRMLALEWEKTLNANPEKPHPVCDYPSIVKLAGHIS